MGIFWTIIHMISDSHGSLRTKGLFFLQLLSEDSQIQKIFCIYMRTKNQILSCTFRGVCVFIYLLDVSLHPVNVCELLIGQHFLTVMVMLPPGASACSWQQLSLFIIEISFKDILYHLIY